MRVLVASDGNLPAADTAELAVRLAGPDGEVILMTAVEVPRKLLDSLRHAYEQVAPSSRIDTDAEYVSAQTPELTMERGWPGDDAFLDRYVTDQTTARLADLESEIRNRGLEPERVGVESEEPAEAVLDAVKELQADVLVIGSHGRGRLEGLLGSVGTKLARRSPVSVVLCRSSQADSAKR